MTRLEQRAFRRARAVAARVNLPARKGPYLRIQRRGRPRKLELCICTSCRAASPARELHAVEVLALLRRDVRKHLTDRRGPL